MIDNKEIYQQLDEIHKFLNKKMDDKERYEFERTLHKDPFLAEAIEGISNFEFAEYERDVLRLSNGSVRTKINFKPLLWIVGILALLVIIYFATQIKFPEKKSKEETVDRELEEMLQFNNTNDSVDQFNKEVDTLSVEPAVENVGLNNNPVPKDSIFQKKPIQSAAKGNVTEVVGLDVENHENTSKVLPLQDYQELSTISKSEISNPENVDDESTAIEISNVDPAQKVMVKGNTRPLPFCGDNDFKLYVDKSVTYPETIVKKTKETVKLKFTVNEEGGLENFQLVSGPSNSAYLNEAIRVIKNGPEWSPAVKNGKLVPEEVVLKINFKP